MKNILLILLSTCLIQLFPQESSMKSGKIKLNLEKSYKFPPNVEYKIEFLDPSKNGQLDAEENCKFKITLTNKGQGIAKNLVTKIEPNKIPGLIFNSRTQIGDLLPGQEKNIEIPISANLEVETQTLRFTFGFTEERGFDLPDGIVNFSTKAFDPPHLQVSDEIAIDDASGNSKIEQGEYVTLKVIIYNNGLGTAKDVKARITLGENVFQGSGSSSNFDLGEIKAKQFKEIKFDLYTNKRATEIPIFISLSESHQKYGLDGYRIPVTLNKIYAVSNEFNIEKTITDLPELNTSKFIVDELKENIPETSDENNDAVAVIIGNRDYIRKDIPPVSFAIRDAALVREYLIRTFGFKEHNIIYKENLTQADFNSIFGTKDNYRGKLYNYIKEGISDVFVYYSGHGAPDIESKQGYFVPVDCDPSLVSLNGYSLNTLYENLSKINYKSLTVLIDACFSGVSEKGSLLKNISPVFITVENPIISKENTIVFTSAGGDQVSSWYPEKQHSLFTYYFLKGIKGDANKNKDNEVTFGELQDYIMDNVPYMARRLNNREQTPQFIGEDKNKILISY